MSTITISSTVLPNFHFSPTPSAVYLRVYLLNPFFSSAGISLQASVPDDKAWYKQVPCSLSTTNLTIPSLTLDSTTDSLDNPNARYGCYFYDQSGRQLKAYDSFTQFRLSHLTLFPSWSDIRTFNFQRVPVVDETTYTKLEVDRLISAHGGVSGLSGDVTTSGTGVAVATLATVNSNVGSFTAANITVNAKGQVTAAANGTAGVDLTTDQTIAGNKSFTAITKLGTGTNINDAGWAGTGGTSVMAHGADSSSGSPNSSGNASLTFQTWRSGGTVGTGVFGYQFGVNRTAGQGDQYGMGVLLRYSPDMSAFTAGGTNYFQTGFKAHIVLSPTNIPAGANAIGFNHCMGERTVANVRAVGLQTEAVNNSATDADNDGSTIDSTISLNVAGGGAKHNSIGIQFEAGQAQSFARGIYPKRNSVHRYVMDFTAAQYDCQGTIATNGTTTITGTSTNFIKELLAGDLVSTDGVSWYEIASDPVSNTSATTTVAVSGTASGLTLTKITQPLRLLRPSYIVATDTISTYKLIGMNANNKVVADASGTGFYLGTSQIQVSSAAGALLASAIAGTTTNDDAAAGRVGEYVSSSIGSGSAVSLTTATAADLTSISLTAGDWDVWVEAAFAPGASTTVSLNIVSVSQTSATASFTAGSFVQTAPAGNVPAATYSLTCGPTRVSLASTATIYGVCSSTFGVSTNSVYGILRARRIR